MKVCRINEFEMLGNIEIVQMTALLAICEDTEVSIGGDLIGGGACCHSLRNDNQQKYDFNIQGNNNNNLYLFLVDLF